MGPAGLKRIATVAANTFRETVRERVLYNLVFFAILMILSALLMRELSVRQDEKIVRDLGLAAMEFFGTLIAIFMGVTLVGKEIERRSLYPLLAKPLSRGELLLGKFAGLAYTLLVNVGVMAVVMALTLLATGRGVDLGLLKAVYAIYLGLLLIVAIALLFSTTTSTALAAVCTVSVVVAGRFSDVVRGMTEVLPEAPTWLIRLLYYAIPNFRNFDFKDRAAYADAIPWGELAGVTLYGALYIAAALLVALWAFRGKDFQ